MTVKVFVLILGAGGIATLWEAVIADVGGGFAGYFKCSENSEKEDLMNCLHNLASLW